MPKNRELGMAKTPASTPSEPSGDSPLHAVISVFLVVHLFCVFVALSANWSSSQLQQRLLGVLRPYLQLLNFDPNLTPYHLTHATIDDVDHRLEILPAGRSVENDRDWTVLPEGGFRGAPSYKRLQRFAKTIAVLAEQENDDATAELARSTGAWAQHQRGVTPRQVRVRKHLLQTREAAFAGTATARDPNDASYFTTAYAANVLVDARGNVAVVKVSGRRDTALPTAERSEGAE